MSFGEFTRKLGRGLDHVKQSAYEKMGIADDPTPYPIEYRVLEEETDRLKTLYDNLIRAIRQLVHSQMSDPSIQEQVNIFVSKFNEKLGSKPSHREITTSHVVAKVALEGKSSHSKGIQKSLLKYGEAMNKIGDCQLEMNNRIKVHVVDKMVELNRDTFDRALAGRRQVQKCRLDLDSVKSKFKNARPERCETLNRDLCRAEDAFDRAVRETKECMEKVAESPDIIQCLSELVNAQRTYHEKVYGILRDLDLGQ